MSVRVGIVGPAGVHHASLRRALEPLLDDPDTRQIIYLGMDGAAVAVVEEWMRDGMSRESFLAQAAELARAGSPDAIRTLLDEEEKSHRLARIRCLPEPPVRAVEMLEKWILLAVHDKAVLDKDDIANAHVILYGKAKHAGFKRFGPRCFFTPGPLSSGLIGQLELLEQGDLAVRAYDMHGNLHIDEVVEAGDARLVVTT